MTRWERTGAWAIFGGIVGFMLMRPLELNPIPLPPWVAIPVAVIAAILLWLGSRVKQRRNGHPEAISALGASRVAMLAVACERVSACFGAMTLILTLSNLFDIPTAYSRGQALAVGLLFLACLALFVVALIVEKWCHIDDDELAEGSTTPPIGKRAAGPAA